MLNEDYEVQCFTGATRKQSELLKAFDRVAPKPNWKTPIDKTIRDNLPHDLIVDSVVHFTGARPALTIYGKSIRVRAPGYYATIGA